MSLLKWTLAMAGTAMGMRYLSERHRRRIADGGGSVPTRRVSGQDATSPWSTAQGSDDAVGGLGSGSGLGSASGLGSSIGAGSSTSVSGAASFGHDDLLAPDSDLTPGSSPSRY